MTQSDNAMHVYPFFAESALEFTWFYKVQRALEVACAPGQPTSPNGTCGYLAQVHGSSD